MRGKWAWFGAGSSLLVACGAAPRGAPEPPPALTLLHSSDVHSRLWPFRDRISRTDAELGLGTEGALAEVGGAARLATLLATERRRGAVTWLDSGDLLEGAPVFGRYGGAVEVELWGALGVSAMALGNHELSLAGPELEALFSAARFPVLSANLTPGNAWLAPAATLFAGVTPVAVIGCSNPQSPPSLGAAHNPWELSVVSSSASVQAAVDELAPRAALVVVLSHLGLDADRELVRRTSGIDLVLGGHQHIVTLEPQWQEDCQERELQQARGCSPRRVPIVHSGAYGRYLSRVELSLASEQGSPGALEVRDVTQVQLPVSEDVVADSATSAFLEPYRAPPAPPIGYLPEPLSRSSGLGGDSPLGNFVTDALQLETRADVVLLNSSGLRDDLEEGPLLSGDLDLAFPFGEPWRLVWLDGRELRAGLLRAARKSAARACESALQVAGLWLRIDCAACEGERLDCLRAGRGERELEDDERLLVALPEYLALPGADFEAIGLRGTALALSVTDALRRVVAAAPRLEHPNDCARELEQMSTSRCAEAFGIDCPARGARALDLCSALPRVEGARDGRIEMLP